MFRACSDIVALPQAKSTPRVSRKSWGWQTHRKRNWTPFFRCPFLITLNCGSRLWKHKIGIYILKHIEYTPRLIVKLLCLRITILQCNKTHRSLSVMLSHLINRENIREQYFLISLYRVDILLFIIYKLYSLVMKGSRVQVSDSAQENGRIAKVLSFCVSAWCGFVRGAPEVSLFQREI